MPTPPINTHVRLLPLNPDVRERTSLGKSRIYQLIAAGQFPRPVKMGRRIAFAEAEIEAWILARLAERSTGGAT